MANFQRTKFHAYKKLGSGQKSMIKYKRATGRHNKTRQKWRSRPPMVEIGYKNKCATSGMVEGKRPILVYNLNDLKKANKDNIIIIGKVGNLTRMEIAKEILAKKLEVSNLNIPKFMKAFERSQKIKNKDKKTQVKKEDKPKTEETKK